MAECTCCKGNRTKNRTEKEYKDLMNRLNRIEGQVRGVKNMLDDSAYCVDILTQVSAIRAALGSFSKVLLENHLRTCAMEDIKAGKEDAIDELIDTINKLMK